MPTVECWVPHEPVAQPRPVVTTRNGVARAYIRARHPVHGWRTAVAQAVEQALRDSGTSGPRWAAVELHVTYYLQRPNRLKRKKDPDGPVLHTCRPDVDNILKSTLDGICESSYIDDDNCIARVCATKFYTAKQGYPGARIVLTWPMEGEQHELTIARAAQQMDTRH